MTERFTGFANTETGLLLMLNLTLNLRRAGFRTRALVETMTVGKLTFVFHTLEATRAPRPNRRERGCNVR